MIDIVPDVEAVLDHLDAPRCLVAGWSGGGPHALATGARLPERVAGVLSIAGVAPYVAQDLDFLAGMGEENITEFGHALDGEAKLRPYLEEVGEDMAASFREALRTGVDGWLDDDLAFTQAWGFDLAEIAVPTFVSQGSADLMVPFSHGQWLAARIPGVTAHLLEGEGHLSVNVGAIDRMLDDLIATLPTG